MSTATKNPLFPALKAGTRLLDPGEPLLKGDWLYVGNRWQKVILEVPGMRTTRTPIYAREIQP